MFWLLRLCNLIKKEATTEKMLDETDLADHEPEAIEEERSKLIFKTAGKEEIHTSQKSVSTYICSRILLLPHKNYSIMLIITASSQNSQHDGNKYSIISRNAASSIIKQHDMPKRSMQPNKTA